MTEPNKELLSRFGWEVECESPLEIRHLETGSFATKLAALYVVQGIRADEALDTLVVSSPAAEPRAHELATLIQRAIDWVSAARKLNTEEDRKIVYDMVFSAGCSQRIADLRTSLGLSFEYFDPDTSYEDDVTAYVNALKEWAQKRAPFYPELDALR